jgi:hypothetical protein
VGVLNSDDRWFYWLREQDGYECSNQTGSLFGLLRQIMPIELISPLEPSISTNDTP